MQKLIQALATFLPIAIGTIGIAGLISCGPDKRTGENEIATDSASIAGGKLLFTQNCAACHNFKNDGIGPQLGGLTKKVPADWIRRFVRNPKQMIESGEERSKTLFEKFPTVMPPFDGSDEDINQLVAFLSTKRAPDPRKTFEDSNALKNPIPVPIPMSDLVVEAEVFTVIPPSDSGNVRTRITKTDFEPTSKELFIVDLRGKLYRIKGGMPEVYLDLAALKPKFMHKPGHATGFGSFAFHPNFSKNGLLYTTHAEFPGSGKADFEFPDSIKVFVQWVLSEWKTNQPGAFPFTGVSRELLRVNMLSQIHGVQEIAFNPLAKKSDADYGLLYVGIGDGGSAENGYGFLCHNPEKIWGTVLRIDPTGSNSRNGKYGIPKSNPFVSSPNANFNGEIFAYGFRNPHRITWSRSGQILVSNVGHHTVEALYMIKAGSDCGWPVREGGFVIDATQNMHNIYPLPADDAKNNFTYPVAQYDHDEGDAIAGGLEYWGSKIPELKGKFIFGDIVRGRLFYVEMKDLKPGVPAPVREWRISVGGAIKSLRELTGEDKVDERFGRDGDGEFYITTKPDGKVYKLVSARTVVN